MIPKKIHTTWISKDILESSHPMAVNGIQSLKKLNPNWSLELSNNSDIDYYLKHHLDKQTFFILKNLHAVQKSDLWRLFKLYFEGGMYVDVDRYVNIPLDDRISKDIECVLCTCGDLDFSHDIMISSPGNPIFQTAINLYLERCKNNTNSTYFLGPQTYFHSVCYNLIGKIIFNSTPSLMNNLRDKIDKINFLQSFREELPNNTFVYKGGDTWQEWENTKRSFYKQFNLNHWTGEW